jgi:hypothetical protein
MGGQCWGFSILSNLSKSLSRCSASSLLIPVVSRKASSSSPPNFLLPQQNLWVHFGSGKAPSV